jgi:hypothetical protein
LSYCAAMQGMLFEAVVVKHPHVFSADVVEKSSSA